MENLVSSYVVLFFAYLDILVFIVNLDYLEQQLMILLAIFLSFISSSFVRIGEITFFSLIFDVDLCLFYCAKNKYNYFNCLNLNKNFHRTLRFFKKFLNSKNFFSNLVSKITQ